MSSSAAAAAAAAAPAAPALGRKAEWLYLPQDRIVTVEHPCIVNDIDNGLRSLGGEHHVGNLLSPPGQSLSVGLSFHPQDPLAKKVVSREVTVQNILLRVTLPKRTGRKRKRGSDQPFEFHPDHHLPKDVTPGTRPLDSSQLLQHLRDNAESYTIEPMGTIRETHRFRSLPDFQVKTSHQPIMRQIGQHLVDASLDSIKRFDLDITPGFNPKHGVVPPPTFSALPQTMNYGYKQNQGVSTITDAQGQVKTVNLQKPKKRAVLAVAADAKQVPTGPPPDLTPLDQTNVYLIQAVKNITALLEKRPIVTRRVAMNLIDWGSESLFKEATQYVGYSFKSGPWRDALVKWGIDPRTDPKYRMYQTLSFQLMTKDKLMAAAKKMPDGRNTWIRSERYRKDELPSHEFDGKGITTNGKTWQMIDIKEPLIRGLLDTTDLRETCDSEGWGWYHNGTMGKVRIIMRDMIGMMLLGQSPDMKSYEILCTIPNIVDPKTYNGCYFQPGHGDRVLKLSSEIRSLAKTDMVLKAKIRAASTAAATAAAVGKEVVGPGRQNGDGDKSTSTDETLSGTPSNNDGYGHVNKEDNNNPDDGVEEEEEGAEEEAEEEEADFEVEGDDLNASDADEVAEDGGEDEDGGDEDEET